MPFPESCFIDLIGIRGICDPVATTYYLDDVPGIDLSRLADVAEADAPTGEKTGLKLIESAARMLVADVEAMYDAHYKVETTLVSGCSTCGFTGAYASGSQRGVLVKDLTSSSFSRMVIDRLTVRLNTTGLLHVVIDDGDASNQRVIEFDFLTADHEYEFQGLNYKTKSKRVRIYMQEVGTPLAQLSCKVGSSGCGCSGRVTSVSDLVYTGTLNGADTQQAYGFQPCAMIRCDADDLLCFMAHSAPRMIGMALLFKVAELYYTTVLQSTRNNKVAGAFAEDTKEDIKKYAGLYKDKLNGRGTSGVKEIVFSTLQKTSDVCVVCNSLVGVSWATG